MALRLAPGTRPLMANDEPGASACQAGQAAPTCGLGTPINNFRAFRAIVRDRAVAGLQTPYYITPDTNRSSRGPFLEGMGAFRGRRVPISRVRTVRR